MVRDFPGEELVERNTTSEPLGMLRGATLVLGANAPLKNKISKIRIKPGIM